MAFTTLVTSNGIDFKHMPLGFSWTMFFFGPYPMFARKEWFAGIIMLILSVASFNLSGMIAAFFYNKIYAKSILQKGYRVLIIPKGISVERITSYLGVEKVPYLGLDVIAKTLNYPRT